MTQRFDQDFFQQVSDQAQQSPRKRANSNVHTDYQAPVQRLFIAFEPDTYFRPHLHSQPEKWEFFFMVQGRMSFLVFDDLGKVVERHELSAEGPCKGLEIPYNTWHCAVAGDAPAIFFEVKQGPYIAFDDKGFAPWAPPEGSTLAVQALQQLKSLQVGDTLNLEE